ncbi:MAG: hypothetical protein RRZ24_11590 [Clostridia bacterium]
MILVIFKRSFSKINKAVAFRTTAAKLVDDGLMGVLEYRPLVGGNVMAFLFLEMA